jgi:hypothetical protein
MGRGRSCDGGNIPMRPDSEVCLWNTDGSLSCYDPRANPSQYARKLTLEDVVLNIKDYTEQEKWIKSTLDACR